MTTSIIQQKFVDSVAGGATLALTPDSPLTIYSAVVVAVTCENSRTITSVTDGTNTYSLLDTLDDVVNSRRTSLFVVFIATSGPLTITATFQNAGATLTGIAMIEIGGAYTLGFPASLATLNAAPVGVDSITSGVFAPVYDPYTTCGMLVGFAFVPSTATPSAGSGFTSGTAGWKFGSATDGALWESKRLTTAAPVAATYTPSAADGTSCFGVVIVEAPTVERFRLSAVDIALARLQVQPEMDTTFAAPIPIYIDVRLPNSDLLPDLIDAMFEQGWTYQSTPTTPLPIIFTTEVTIGLGAVPATSWQIPISDANTRPYSMITCSISGKPAFDRAPGDAEWDGFACAAYPDPLGNGQFTVYITCSTGSALGTRILQYTLDNSLGA